MFFLIVLLGVRALRGPKTFTTGLEQKEMHEPLVKTQVYLALQWCLEHFIEICTIAAIALLIIYILLYFTRHNSLDDKIIIEETQNLNPSNKQNLENGL